MPKPDLMKHTLHLRKGDYDKIREHLRGTTITAADVVRGLVSSYVDKVVDAPVEVKPVEGLSL